MTKTLADVRKEAEKKYGTAKNTYDDFPVGSRVKIITPTQDFNFFYGETGVVIKNKKRYLGIIVEYDIPRHYKDGSIETCFNFEPRDLSLISRGPGINERAILMDLE